MYIKPQREKNSGQQEISQIEETDEADVQSVAVSIAELHLKDEYVSLKVNLDERSHSNKRADSQIREAAQKRCEIVKKNSYIILSDNINSPLITKPLRKGKIRLALLKSFADAENSIYKSLSVCKIFDSFKTEINLSDLLQYSSFLVTSLKKFMTRKTVRRHCQSAAEVQAVKSQAVTLAADVNT
ncbi:hypothetical protein EMCG_00148 [[Emmonsia] crescens]|uniref:Uncharacterized protein n=1 Tax=[Emmonsia] crescens TaxID=73230 RepID=A0A0G2J7C3_9EURO|nr:hypothetical protein EMCG_00148 [Emmonsia crescens UAMH 3008]